MNELYLVLEQTNISIEQWIRIFYITGCFVCAPMALFCIAWFLRMALAMPAKQAKKMLRKSLHTPLSEIKLDQPLPQKAIERTEKEPDKQKLPLILRTLTPESQKILSDIGAKISLDDNWTGSVI